MHRQDTASLHRLPRATAAQPKRRLISMASGKSKTTSPIRTVCSSNWARMLGPTRRRARKQPR